MQNKIRYIDRVGNRDSVDVILLVLPEIAGCIWRCRRDGDTRRVDGGRHRQGVAHEGEG